MASYLLVLTAIVIFSGTAPMTKMALSSFNGLEIASARILIGGLLALGHLLIKGKLNLLKPNLKRGFITGFGMTGFPLFFSHAMEGLPATFSSVALGLLPSVTGLISIFIFKEKVEKNFLFFAIIGAVSVVVYSFTPNFESFYHLGVLFFSILLAGTCYANGSQLAKTTSGPLSVSIALTLILPFSLMLAIFTWGNATLIELHQIQDNALWALLYLSILSQFLGFFPFYSGLSKVGAAKGIQLQLMQPFFSLLLSVWLLDESTNINDYLTLATVLGCIYKANQKKSQPYPNNVCSTRLCNE